MIHVMVQYHMGEPSDAHTPSNTPSNTRTGVGHGENGIG